jgi:hypothetical protein
MVFLCPPYLTFILDTMEGHIGKVEEAELTPSEKKITIRNIQTVPLSHSLSPAPPPA